MGEMKRVTIPGYGTYEVHDPDTVAIGDALAGKAPAGYGLGEMQGEKAPIADAHDIWKTGWYFVSPGVTANVPVGGVLRAEVHTYRHLTLTLYTNEYLSDGSTTILRQSFVNGVWKDWEFENPPMVSGVEYRTAEQVNGESVYCKHFDLGPLPNNGTIQQMLNISNMKSIVRFSCSAHNDETPVNSFALVGSVTDPVVDVNQDYVSITTKFDGTTYTHTLFTVYYLKK